MWTAGLQEWFAENGRHDLPWRLTTDPWKVLVSEVMLQQTAVPRVLPRWARFLERWATPTACATAPLDEVLREWQGLGYPRRARALWLAAAHVTEHGWPRDESGLRTLPGVGTYTARALLAFSDLGDGAAEPPRDVNLGRVAARAALGREPYEARPAVLDRALRDGRPATMPVRQYTYALFDVGAANCKARPLCDTCPLRAACAWRRCGPGVVVSPARRQGTYAGSLRQLRGALLAAALHAADATPGELARAVSEVPGATPERVREALDGLVTDGLIDGRIVERR